MGKGDNGISTFGSTFGYDRVAVAENGVHHWICLEILHRPCIFEIPDRRKKKVFFLSCEVAYRFILIVIDVY